MDDIKYLQMDFKGLDEIEPMWEKLNNLQQKVAPNFSGNYTNMTYDKRRKSFLDKASDGKLSVFIAQNINDDSYAGYCILIVDKVGTGEIDSLFIDPAYREKKVGDGLVTRAIEWFEKQGAIDKIISVSAGNEYALGFYAKYGFTPVKYILKWKG